MDMETYRISCFAKKFVRKIKVVRLFQHKHTSGIVKMNYGIFFTICITHGTVIKLIFVFGDMSKAHPYHCFNLYLAAKTHTNHNIQYTYRKLFNVSVRQN